MAAKRKRITVRDMYDMYLKVLAEVEQLRMEVVTLKARWTERPPPKTH